MEFQGESLDIQKSPIILSGRETYELYELERTLEWKLKSDDWDSISLLSQVKFTSFWRMNSPKIRHQI